jgi:hypothetical protein
MVSVDSRIADSIARADLVIIGYVNESSAYEVEHPKITEHDPLWTKAVVNIQEVIKGNASAGDNIEVIFPNSYDVKWYKVPKLYPHQKSIFILHLKKIENLNVVRYTVVDESDVLGLDNLNRIAKLLNSSVNSDTNNSTS